MSNQRHGTPASNINFFLYIRFVFGFYHDFQTSKPVRWLARCYCCVVCASIIFFFIYLTTGTTYPAHLIYIIGAEYSLYVLISLVKGNGYLLQYYKKPLVGTITTNCIYEKSTCAYLKAYVGVMFSLRAGSFLKCILMHREYSTKEHLFAFSDFIMWFTIVMGRSPLLFIFALFYTRVKKMRRTLETNNFECRKQGTHHPRWYMQVYQAILDGLEETTRSLKLQLVVFVVFSIVYFWVETLYLLYFLRDLYPYLKLAIYEKFELAWLMVEISLSCTPLFLSAVLADMVVIEIQKILAVTIERLIACKNERDRAEIEKLFELMRSRPFKFTICRVVPLNVRSVLSFASFTFTTLTAILQVKNWST